MSVCACVPHWPPVVIIGDKIESSVFCVVIVIFLLSSHAFWRTENYDMLL